jgi:hypothetical protein
MEIQITMHKYLPKISHICNQIPGVFVQVMHALETAVLKSKWL